MPGYVILAVQVAEAGDPKFKACLGYRGNSKPNNLVRACLKQEILWRTEGIPER